MKFPSGAARAPFLSLHFSICGKTKDGFEPRFPCEPSRHNQALGAEGVSKCVSIEFR
jgi:hypothetical protein